MNECNKKLVASFQKIDRIADIFDSTRLEKILYETAKN